MTGRGRALLAGALLLSAAGTAAAQPGGTPQPTAPGVAASPSDAGGPVLRAGTAVPMKTTQRLSSKRAHQGQRFDLEVIEDILVDGLVVIPRGSRGVGEVSRVIEKGMFGKSGKLQVRVLFVEAGGTRIRLDGQARDRGKSGVAPVLLAVPLIGLSATMISGTSAVIPPGTMIEGHVYQDMPLRSPSRALSEEGGS